MIAQYADRIEVHPDRYGSTRPLPPRWVVIHTSEGPEGDDRAEQLGSFLTRPGDRVSSSGSRYGSSYHAIADTHLRVIPAVADDRVAFSAPGANNEGLHICIPGRADQTREEWLSGSTRWAITSVAAYLLDTKARYGIPTERLTVAELRAGTRGYCDHAAIRDAFGRTTHYDVGPHFPWDVLSQDIRSLRPTTNPGALPMRYYAKPPSSRTDNPPHLVVWDGAVRYRTNYDLDPLPEHTLNEEQYHYLLRCAGLA